MKKPLVALLIVVSLLFSGCDTNNQRGIKDSRPEFMKELQASLADNGIPFEVDNEGYVRYPSKYEEAVERIKKQVDKNIASEIGTKFEDKNQAEYFRSLLKERGISFRAETREDGEWTYWRPESKAQQNEIEIEVVSKSLQRKSP